MLPILFVLSMAGVGDGLDGSGVGVAVGGIVAVLGQREFLEHILLL